MKREKPIEGIDFYRENGRMIFTKLYHQKRGWCCGCHCRHCPWKAEVTAFSGSTKIEFNYDISDLTK